MIASLLKKIQTIYSCHGWGGRGRLGNTKSQTNQIKNTIIISKHNDNTQFMIHVKQTDR